jgi:hypothetical protein
MGSNGSGKSNLVNSLNYVQKFVMGNWSSIKAFGASTRTRWEKQRREQTIELDVRGNGGLYRYRLVIEHDEREPGKNRISSESLRHEDKPIVEFVNGEIRIFREDGTVGPQFPAKSTRSAIGALDPGTGDRLLTWFKEWISNVWLLNPDPRDMSAQIEPGNDGWLVSNLANFASWYLRSLTIRPALIFKATAALEKVLPGFLELRAEQGYLCARFGDDSTSETYRFDELSDGQRALIALYVVRHALVGPGNTLVIDEPENYVSLREIQPWLTEMTDLALSTGGPQIWIISHHPEVLNLLAVDYGWKFFRIGNGPTRVERFKAANGMDAAETVARGWDDA